MSTSPEFVRYLCEQLEGLGAVRSRKMFGEYMVYLNDKPVLLVCDDTPFLKMLPCVAPLLKDRPAATPYEGAKDHYVLDPDDGDTLRAAVLALEAVTTIPKKNPPRKKQPAPGNGPVPWDAAFPQHIQPSVDEIAAWVKSPLFLELRDWMAETYGVQPSVEFSRCSMDRGWNVKYKKGSKSLCACYVRSGWFTAMVALGARQTEELAVLLPTFSAGVQALFQRTPPFNGGKWLVMDVKSAEQLEDVKRLISIKAKPAKKQGRAV